MDLRKFTSQKRSTNLDNSNNVINDKYRRRREGRIKQWFCLLNSNRVLLENKATPDACHDGPI